jgi:uncharacterized protein with FMN-binding domain
MTAMHKKIVAVAGLTLTAALAGCSATGSEADSPPSPVRTETTTPGTPSRTGSTYADGEYSATGEYSGGSGSIDVAVTLDEGMITDVTVTPKGTDPTARDLQERFAEPIPEAVVGRDIDDVQIDRLAGSSETPDGFNAAIEQIKTQASR